MKNTISLSNTVAMDFGRALFGPIGGTIFAFMVAISCFGALNGTFSFAPHLLFLNSDRRLVLYLLSPGVRCWPGGLSSLTLWPVAHDPKDTVKCGSSASRHHNDLHLNRRWISVFNQLFRCGFLGFLFSHCEFSVVQSCWRAEYHAQVLGLVILRVKEPMLERPYKTWIITPLTFCAVREPDSSSLIIHTHSVQVALFLLCMPIIAAPLPAIAVLGLYHLRPGCLFRNSCALQVSSSLAYRCTTSRIVPNESSRPFSVSNQSHVEIGPLNIW
jgi:hypothetical protein